MVKRKRHESSTSGARSELYSTDVVTIDPNGDFHMIFDDSRTACKKKIVVSRHVLCLSSTIFEAMLGTESSFRETTNPALSRDGFPEVQFKEDDFYAMTVIMNALHLQHHKVPKRTTFDQLHKIAMICDKYDLTRSMGLWASNWAQHFVEQVGKRGFHGWLLIATVFRQDDVFTRMTKHLILNSTIEPDTMEILTAEGWKFDEGVPNKIIDTIRSSRADTVRLIVEGCTTRFARLCHSRPYRRVCFGHDKGNVDLPDIDQAQCDTWNLGCLVQHFPNLRDGQKQYTGTISSVIDQLDKMCVYQKLIADNSHALHMCTPMGLYPIRSSVAKIEGLNLEN